MANQTLTQLTQANTASNGDVLYIVTNYESGSPTLTGDSKQIYFSSLTNSISGVTLPINIDNSIITATGTNPKLNAENNLKFDGNNLNVTGNTTGSGFGWVNTLQVGSATTGGTSTGLTSAIYVVATKTSAQTIPTGTNVINDWTTEYSTAGIQWAPSTGQFSSPRNSVYRVTAIITLTGSSATTINHEISLAISVNSSTSTQGSSWSITTDNAYGQQITSIIMANMTAGVGSIIVSVLNSSSGGVPVSLSTAAGYNKLIIEELGPILTD